MEKTFFALVLFLVVACGSSGPQTAGTADADDSTSPVPSIPVASSLANPSYPETVPPDGGPSEVDPGVSKDLHGRLEVVDAGPLEVLDLVLADAARHMGLALEKLRVSTVETGEWPDASLGCPEPGKTYAQVISRGNKIVVTGKGQMLEYRVAVDGSFWTCRSG